MERSLSWGAIAAGALVAIAATIVLAILGLGMGLGAIAVSEGEPSSAIGAGVALWWIVSALVVFFLAGWTAGRVGGGPFVPRALLSAVLVWALATLGSFYLLSTAAGTLLGGPLAVASESVFTVLADARVEADLEEQEVAPGRGDRDEEREEARAEAARELASRAEGAMDVALWAAFTLLLGGGAAVAGAWFATEPPAWSRRDSLI